MLAVLLLLVFFVFLATLSLLLLRLLTGWKRVKSVFISLSVMGVAIVICLVAFESTVRWIYRDITPTADNGSYSTYRFRKKHVHRRNNIGFREREISTEKADNVYRIAVVGDSFTFGQVLLEESRFTIQLQAALNKSVVRY